MPTDRGGEVDDLAPVIPLFGDGAAAAPAWRSTWADDDTSSDPVDEATTAEAGAVVADRAAVEGAVLKKLRVRQLSEAETRAVIATYALDVESSESLMRGLRRHGYVDDASLAEQLVRSAVERKGQGRQVIAQTLAKRRIPRDVADAALAALPDDDGDRALEFALSKARSMARLDRDTALRRLVGQLSRRGYSSSVAMTAARSALSEQGL